VQQQTFLYLRQPTTLIKPNKWCRRRR